MRVIRHGSTSPVRTDSATPTDAATRAAFATAARQAFAIVDALSAADARGDSARVEQLVRESRRRNDSAAIGGGSTAARAAYLKSLEVAYLSPNVGKHKPA